MRSRYVTSAAVLVVMSAVSYVGCGGVAAGGYGGDSDTPPPPVPGARSVEYRDGSGGVGVSTSIPSGSRFGSEGGAGSPCQFLFHAPDPDGDGPAVAADELRDSMRWRFTETSAATGFGGVTAEIAGQLTGQDAGVVLAGSGPVGSATRTFNVTCAGIDAAGGATYTFLGQISVGPTDPFWNVFDRVDRLWTGLRLDRPEALTIPRKATFGGLPINMPVTMQIAPTPWRAYVSVPDRYRGWVSQLVLVPQSLSFDVVFTPDTGPAVSLTVPCLERSAVASLPGVPMPARGATPDFAEPGQFEAPCTWIPPNKGEVTIRATITYQVVFAVSGYADVLAPYVWSSNPITLRVDELRSVNVRPDGPAGG